jgi:hypothetical protein
MKKTTLYLAGVALVAAAVFSFLRAPLGTPYAEAVTGSVVGSWQLGLEAGRAGRNPQGLAYDGQFLWLVDANFKSINRPRFYKITTGGSIVTSFLAPTLGYPYDANYKGITWDGGYLRLAASGGANGRIYLIDINDPGGDFTYVTVENELPFGTGWEPSQVGAPFVWEVDDKTGKVYRINPATGATEDSFNTDVGTLRRTGGLAYETGADRVWISGYGKNDQIYGYTNAGSFVGSFNAPSTHPMGLTWDGAYLWYVDGCTDYFYKIELTD